jgi:hypothetical protein
MKLYCFAFQSLVVAKKKKRSLKKKIKLSGDQILAINNYDFNIYEFIFERITQ